jgi:hypothetical protein
MKYQKTISCIRVQYEKLLKNMKKIKLKKRKKKQMRKKEKNNPTSVGFLF